MSIIEGVQSLDDGGEEVVVVVFEFEGVGLFGSFVEGVLLFEGDFV